jgi:hypothetical protein
MQRETRIRVLTAVMLVALVWAGLPAAANAQATRGTILGTITDQTGAAMPGVTVVATETRTNVSYDTVTNETGNFTFPNIPDGIYNIKAELQGFKTVVREAIRLAVNTSIRVDLALAVGELAETVTVSGETPLLQTDRTDTGRVLESIQVSAMPLSFNRNFQGMLATVPGATRPFRPHSEFFNPQDSLSTQVNGQSRLANNVQIEGVDNNQRTGLLTVLIPPAEAIDQVSVTTSNYDAEFGRAAGAVTSVVLKSGTNTLRGSAFWFGNTEKTNALPASTYYSSVRTKPPTEYNQFGFTLGGPIRKNKLFYFGDYQYTKDILGRTNRFVVPTEAFRRGDFSGAPTIVYDPATGDAAGNGRLPFPGNQIPASRISTIAQTLMSKIPMPNLTGVALGQPNYQENSTRDKITHSWDAKINYAVNDSNQISGRFSFQRPEITELPPGTYGEWGGPAQGGFLATGTNLTYSTAVNWTHTFSNTFLMEARGGTSYYHNEALPVGYGQNLADQVGIKGINIDEWTSGAPRINIGGGFSGPVLGTSNSLAWDRWERTWQFAATATKVSGNHTIKFGGDWRHSTDMLLQTQDNQGPRGGYSFGGAQTGSPTDAAANSGIANNFASFLLDLPNNIARDLKVIDEPGTKHWVFFGFVHDKWQMTPNLTVDLGLRWEYYDPLVGIEGRGSLSNYDPTTNSLNVSGYGNFADDFGLKKDLNNWNPRLGATYRLDEKTVVRGGFGASTTPFPDNRYAFNYPVKQNNNFSAPNTFAAAGSMSTPFPAPIVLTVPENGIIKADTSLLLSQSYWHVPADLEQGTLYSYNLAFQRELAWGLTGEVAYVGNRSDDILNRFNLNAGMTPGLDRAGQPLYVAFGKTASVELLAWKGKTRYNALQVKLDRRFRNGWLVTNSYTYGKSWDYHSENGGPSTPADVERSWGLSDFTRKHTYVGTFVWSLPWFKDPDAGVLHWVLGNWQVSGILTAQSGTPLNITTSSATLRAPGNTQFPDQTGESQVLGNVGPGQKYFDVSVFVAPQPNQFGSRTRNMGDLFGPRFTNLDFSLVKQFGFGGSRMGEFRVDIWNLPNTLHHNNPNTTHGSTTFGEINSGYGERQMRFSVRFLF